MRGKPEGNSASLRRGWERRSDCTVSVPKPDAEFPVKLFDVFRKELRIMGSFINPDTHQRAVNLINAGKVNISPLITHRYGLDQVEEAIRKQSDPDSIKVLVKP